MTIRRSLTGLSCASLIVLAGCTADDAPSTPSSPTNDAAETAEEAWGDPAPGPGPEIVYGQYPALEAYEIEAYNFARPYDPPNPDRDYIETVIWLAPGEGKHIVEDFTTEQLDEPLELLSDWPHTPPTDLETSPSLVEELRIGFEDSINVTVSPGEDLLFIVTEGDESTVQND